MVKYLIFFFSGEGAHDAEVTRAQEGHNVAQVGHATRALLTWGCLSRITGWG